jgi:high-affinity nickel-transport protein
MMPDRRSRSASKAHSAVSTAAGSKYFPSRRARIVAILGGLIILNVGAWLWALLSFHDRPALLGMALIVYGLGLRHAIDADHIVAIDNVTRKLVEENQRPISVGLFFAMGHSAIILFGSALIACSAGLVGAFERLNGIGETVGTAASALFLFAIAVANMAILVRMSANYRRIRRGCSPLEASLALENRGFVTRILRPFFRLVSRSWHMFPLGLLLGFGVDTATEIAMFGLSAAQAAKGASVMTILVFAVLFCAGMVLVDTMDGVVMLRAYEWAFVRPARKIYYNMVVTLVSVMAAILVGGIEAFDLIGRTFDLKGLFWSVITSAGESFDRLGLGVIVLFLAIWILAGVTYRRKERASLDSTASFPGLQIVASEGRPVAVEEWS